MNKQLGLCFVQVAYLIVDEMHAEHPELVKDAFWDEGVPEELPYTLAAEEFRAEPWQGSAAEVKRLITFFLNILNNCFLGRSVRAAGRICLP